LITAFHRLFWQKQLKAIADSGDRVAVLVIKDRTRDLTIAIVNFSMYAAFLVAIFVYVPNEFPGWLTWILFIREWINEGGQSAVMSPYAELFCFHLLPYTVISISLGYVSIAPGCALLSTDHSGKHLVEKEISETEIIKSLVSICLKLVAKYMFAVIALGAAVRFVFLFIHIADGNLEIADYGMNPYLGSVIDIICLGLMIFGKIFSSIYCSMKFPAYLPAFLLSIWMTIEYWLLYIFIFILGNNVIVPLIFGADRDAVNLNVVLYTSWIVTGCLGIWLSWLMIVNGVRSRMKIAVIAKGQDADSGS